MDPAIRLSLYRVKDYMHTVWLLVKCVAQASCPTTTMWDIYLLHMSVELSNSVCLVTRLEGPWGTCFGNDTFCSMAGQACF